MFVTLILCFLLIYVNAELDKRIIGGRASLSSNWPMMVSIRQKNLPETLKWMQVPYTSENGLFCGGSLVNSGWVVTAASCFPDRDVQKLLNDGQFTQLKVRKLVWLMRTLVRRMKLEEYRVCLNEDCSRWRAISNIIIHPGYLILLGRNVPGFDIALVKLSTPVGPFIPGLVPKATWYNTNQSYLCKTAGWGVQDVDNKINSGEFREFDVKIVASKYCQLFIKKWELCGLGEKNEDTRSDFCFFDSGGPLMCKDKSEDDNWHLLGLISRGTKDNCGDTDQRGIYTDVSAYSGWMHAVMKQQSKI